MRASDLALSLSFFLVSDLFPNFFFDLLESFQEELLNLASLSDNDLTKSSYISEFSIFHTKIFLMICDVFSLLFDYLIMLIFPKFFFFLEVLDNLL